MGFLKSSATLTISDTIIDYETYPFSWSYTDTDDDTPSYLEVEIPNLTKTYRESISIGDGVVFNFGFDDDTGTLIQGYVDKKSYDSNDAVTDYTNLKILDTDSDIYGKISTTYVNKSSKYIITDIVSKLGMTLKLLNLKTNVSHINDYTAYGKGLPILKKLVNQCGSKIRVEGSQVYIYNEDDETVGTYYLVNFETGLLKAPEEYTEDGKSYTHVFASLANHNLRKNSIVKVDIDDFKSYCKILKMNISDWKAIYYVKTLEVQR